jgi:hypothetical protein
MKVTKSQIERINVWYSSTSGASMCKKMKDELNIFWKY